MLDKNDVSKQNYKNAAKTSMYFYEKRNKNIL